MTNDPALPWSLEDAAQALVDAWANGTVVVLVGAGRRFGKVAIMRRAAELAAERGIAVEWFGSQDG